MYKIQHCGHSSFATAESGSWAQERDSVVGGTHPQQWKIVEVGSDGDYWCVFNHWLQYIYNGPECSIATKNTEVCWSLKNGEIESPVGHKALCLQGIYAYVSVDRPWETTACTTEPVELHQSR